MEIFTLEDFTLTEVSQSQHHVEIDKINESTENNPICHGCDKPMKLECGNSKTRTTQMWYCTECHTFRVINPN